MVEIWNWSTAACFWMASIKDVSKMHVNIRGLADTLYDLLDFGDITLKGKVCVPDTAFVNVLNVMWLPADDA